MSGINDGIGGPWLDKRTSCGTISRLGMVQCDQDMDRGTRDRSDGPGVRHWDHVWDRGIGVGSGVARNQSGGGKGGMPSERGHA